MRDLACRWFIVKKAKILPSKVKHFLFFSGVRKCSILTDLLTKLVPASFSCFYDHFAYCETTHNFDFA